MEEHEEQIEEVCPFFPVLLFPSGYATTPLSLVVKNDKRNCPRSTPLPTTVLVITGCVPSLHPDARVRQTKRQAEVPCSSALSMAGVDASKLSAVLVIGGCCHTPALQDIAQRLFGKAGGAGGQGAGVIMSPELSEEMVVLGATLEARKIIYQE